MAITQTILTQDLADVLALIDNMPDMLCDEMLDLQHVAAFLPRTKILASMDYAVTTGSDLCIIFVGACQIVEKSYLSLLPWNLTIFRDIVVSLARNSPDALLLMVSNPTNILTYIT
ncbi:L-lactate dehydrogenase-like [Elaeis guineensis]|uniref:L-lactate dehydrogenase-like n=1 Tax=Elaeis guineensis var. tenera TaxID=51953 RepID=A0A8N4EXK8_ELAGV|nr:L-lactate dehydrogenase-like [Elaeis guineensis]